MEHQLDNSSPQARAQKLWSMWTQLGCTAVIGLLFLLIAGTCVYLGWLWSEPVGQVEGRIIRIDQHASPSPIPAVSYAAIVQDDQNRQLQVNLHNQGNILQLLSERLSLNDNLPTETFTITYRNGTAESITSNIDDQRLADRIASGWLSFALVSILIIILITLFFPALVEDLLSS